MVFRLESLRGRGGIAAPGSPDSPFLWACHSVQHFGREHVSSSSSRTAEGQQQASVSFVELGQRGGKDSAQLVAVVPASWGGFQVPTGEDER